MDMRTIVKVCEFLGISVSDALNMSDDRDLSSRIAAILEIEPKLKEVFEEAISRVESGKASAELIHDIVLYANYKLSLGA